MLKNNYEECFLKQNKGCTSIAKRSYEIFTNAKENIANQEYQIEENITYFSKFQNDEFENEISFRPCHFSFPCVKKVKIVLNPSEASCRQFDSLPAAAQGRLWVTVPARRPPTRFLPHWPAVCSLTMDALGDIVKLMATYIQGEF